MNWSIGRILGVMFGLALLALLAITALAVSTTRALVESRQMGRINNQAISEVGGILSEVMDAETGQRGYLITGNATYLVPYTTTLTSLTNHFTQLKALPSENPRRPQEIADLEQRVQRKLDELQQTIALRREQGFVAAQAVVLADADQTLMAEIRDGVARIAGEENALLAQRRTDIDDNIQGTVGILVLLGALNFGLLGLAFTFVRRDVTNRSRAEAVRLQTTLASIGDAVIVTDRAGRVTFLNPVAATLTGWPQAEALGQGLRTIFTIVTETTRAPVENPADKAMRLGTVVGLANHTILIARDGTERPIDDSGAPIRDGKGAITGVVLVFRDITERREAEAARTDLLAREQAARAAAEANEQYYRFLAESIPQFVWTARLDGWRDYYNQRWYEYSGLTVEQAQGWGWESALHPDDLQPCLDRWTHAVQTGEPYEIEHRFRRADGVYRWHLSRALPARDARGQIVKWFGTSTDIDDQKHSVRALEVLAEASDVLASSLEYEGTVASVARLVVPDLADWCSVDLLDGEGDLQRLAVAHVDPAKVEWAYELQRRFPPDKSAPSGAYNVVRTGQTEFIPEITPEMLAAVTDPELLQIIDAIGFTSVITAPLTVRDRTVGVLTLVSAESHRRYTAADVRLAEDLAYRAAVAIDNARLYEDAQRAVYMRDQFLSIAAHELKTPLTSLLGYTQLVQRRTQREGTLNERDQRALRLVAEQAARLNRMVSSLLDLSRLESGQLSIESAPLDLGALAQQLVEEVQPSLNQHRIVLEVPATPLLIAGDALRLEQVLQNLIQNAVKYDLNGGTITVRVAEQDGSACVGVTDQGIGIPDHALPKLFSRFYRAPNVNPQQISGMGLGLYVVKEIVALHGGTIHVTSVEGAGSTFTICLPLLTVERMSQEVKT